MNELTTVLMQKMDSARTDRSSAMNSMNPSPRDSALPSALPSSRSADDTLARFIPVLLAPARASSGSSTHSSAGTSRPTDRGGGQAWIAAPEASPKSAIIVMHDWFGVTDEFKQQVWDWFGDGSSLIIILDLYRGHVAATAEEASLLVQEFDHAQSLRDVMAAIKYAKKKHGCTQFGLVGFCVSGGIALASAVHLRDLAACVVIYGICDPRLAAPDKSVVPMQLHFGEEDSVEGLSDAKSQAQLESALMSSGVSYEFFRYPGCDHSFCDVSHASNPKEKAAAEKVKQRTRQFLRTKLQVQMNDVM